MSRWTHFRASLSRQARGRGKDTIAIAVLTALGIVMTLWIFTQQKASLPSWAPLVGEDFASRARSAGSTASIRLLRASSRSATPAAA